MTTVAGGRAAAVSALIALTAALAAAPAAGMAVRPRVRPDLENAGQGPLRFHAQTACFRAAAGRQRLEVTFAFSTDRLQILGDSGSLRAGYSFSTIISDRAGRQVAGDVVERSLTEADAALAHRHDRVLTGAMSFDLPPGRYRLSLRCSDANSQRAAVLDKAVTVPDLAREPAISSLRFERLSGGDTIPWPARRYGDVMAPLVAYVELYPGGQPGRQAVARLWSLDDERTVWERRIPVAAADRVPLRIAVAADSLTSGAYDLRVALQDSAGTELGATAATVVVENLHRLSERDFRDRVDQLRYISRGRELDSLRHASGGMRDTLWQRFWDRRDPTPGTERNEAKEEYYARVEHADRAFSLGIKPGWRTDRGQVYIRYGAPDDVEHHPFDSEHQAYEIWHYYRDGRKFIFSDTQGFGEFLLVYPSNERMR
ncbi:MAG: GWxTD domain-containing protein [Candidatus Edwardsbacteria bacterium]|jgi:GWxTD domain-containing protein|nr:GWxTD domain-containing protein [Candidatus Edwardsbacteria bacterium]